jgi:hypothetical protein
MKDNQITLTILQAMGYNLTPVEILDLERIAEERRDLFLQCAEQYYTETYGGQNNEQ